MKWKGRKEYSGNKTTYTYGIKDYLIIFTLGVLTILILALVFFLNTFRWTL